MITQFSNFKRYDPKTRKRVAIFGDLQQGTGIDNKYLRITIIPCSKGDQYSREFAKYIYDGIIKKYIYPEHTVERIPLLLTDNPKKVFLDFCSKTYVKPRLVPVKWALKFPPFSKVG